MRCLVSFSRRGARSFGETAHLSSLHGDFVSLDRTSSLVVVLQPSRELTESINAPIGILTAAHRAMLPLEDPQRFLARDENACVPSHGAEHDQVASWWRE